MKRLHKPGTMRARGARKRSARAVRILLVEDHASLAALRSTLLEQQGYAVAWTPDGLEACRLLDQEDFDLVVTDARLPSGSGWDVARAAKQRRLPVILTTGWPLPSSFQDADYILRKPSSLRQLLATIRRALGDSISGAPRLD